MNTEQVLKNVRKIVAAIKVGSVPAPNKQQTIVLCEQIIQIAELNKELSDDAMRYRWLRTNALDCQETEGLEIVRLIPAHRSPNYEDIDRAIDNAMYNAELRSAVDGVGINRDA